MNRRQTRLATIAMLFGLLAAAPLWAQGACDGIAPLDNTSLNGIVVVSGVTDPVAVRSAPGDSDRLFIVQRNGVIRVHNRGDAANVTSVYLDIDARVDSNSFNEMGLLGLAFHPEFQSNKFFYVNYTDNFGNTIVSRFTEVGGVGNAAGEKTVLSFSQPEVNHNGGDIHFGPLDGYLYIATGDGGGGGDGHGACGNGQNTGNLLGKILRVDVNSTTATSPDCSNGSYTIPDDNALIDGAGGDCDEIFAYGLRNPWRFSLDALNGDMYVGDVGQGCWEEVNWTTPAASNGANFGWRQMEGMHCYNAGAGCNPASANGCSPPCNDPSLTLPVHETDSSGECSVIGGFNYRGCRMPNFEGKYFWGDYCSAYIKSFEVVGGLKTNEQTWTSQVGVSLGSGDLSSFGTDVEGELYYTDRDGQVILITAPFADFEVSGAGVGGADELLLDNGNWSWEDLQYSSQYPITSYNLYRSDSATGIFDCVHSTAGTSWTGDPASPAIGAGFYYTVVAENNVGVLSSPGGARTLGAACP